MLTFIIPWNPRLGCGPCVHNTCEQFYDFQCIARTVFMFLSQWISCFDGICDFRERPKRELMKNGFEEIMGSKPPNVLVTEDWLQTSNRGCQDESWGGQEQERRELDEEKTWTVLLTLWSFYWAHIVANNSLQRHAGGEDRFAADLIKSLRAALSYSAVCFAVSMSSVTTQKRKSV